MKKVLVFYIDYSFFPSVSVSTLCKEEQNKYVTVNLTLEYARNSPIAKANYKTLIKDIIYDNHKQILDVFTNLLLVKAGEM